MNLDKLVYLCVKNVKYLDDPSFTYEGFKSGAFKDSPDYSLEINNVFLPLNEAISRLSDLERIPYAIQETNIDMSGFIDVSELNVKEVVNVAQLNGNDYCKLEHRKFGIDKILITSIFYRNLKTYIEYKEEIPYFDETFLPYLNESTGEYENDDCDLSVYGINNSMCNYIMEYVMGKLSEDIAPEIANMHITRAEQYFANLSTAKQAFKQNRVYRKYAIGD